jgi:plasmid stability protein
MATIHIRNVGDELVKALKIEAVRRGITFRELVLAKLVEYSTAYEIVEDAPITYESGRVKTVDAIEALMESAPHNTKTCRVYRCAQCIALGKHF